MKLTYRLWRLYLENKIRLDEYAAFPLNYAERRLVFLYKDELVDAIQHLMVGGKRVKQTYDLLLPHIPGYNASIMTPDIEDMRSYHQAWRVERLRQEIAPASYPDWHAVLWYPTDEDANLLVTATLADWVAAKNNYAWQDLRTAKIEKAKLAYRQRIAAGVQK